MSGLLAVGVGPQISLKTSNEARLPAMLVDAGVEPGMAITAVNGKPVTRFDQVESAVAAAVGRPVEVTFSREKDDASGKPAKSATVKIAAVPQLTSTDDGVVNFIGLVPATQIAAVSPKMPTEEAGVKAGDLIVRIGGYTDYFTRLSPQMQDEVMLRTEFGGF